MDVFYQPDSGGISAAFGKLSKSLDSSGAIRDGLAQASALYLGFIRRRFVEQSRGGGEWPDLAHGTKVSRLRKTKAGKRKLATIRKRGKSLSGQTRKLSAGVGGAIRQRIKKFEITQISGMNFAILRDTSSLLNSLSTGAPGSFEEFTPDSVRIGTAITYAKYHQAGGRHLPQRKIIVPPDEPTSRRIQQIISATVVKALKGA